MYTLYYLQDACSLATHTILNELKQTVDLVDFNQLQDPGAINPLNTVPVLQDGDKTLFEGAAIMLYLLEKHQSPMLPQAGPAREQAIEDILFANATMHPAYSRLFFIDRNISDPNAQDEAYQAAAAHINALWESVEARLQHQPFLGGATASAADIMLCVYSRWGAAFSVDLHIGEKTQAMLESIKALPAFTRAVAVEAAVTHYPRGA